MSDLVKSAELDHAGDEILSMDMINNITLDLLE